MQGDKAFDTLSFKTYIDNRSIPFRVVPHSIHSNNPIESKHGIKRIIFLKLRNAEPDASAKLNACRAVALSNDLYGIDLRSSFELPKGFFKLLTDADIKVSPDDLIRAH